MIERLLAPYEEQLQQAESMPGWQRRAVQDALAETGADMTRFSTGAHLASWAGRTPVDRQSGARKGRARAKKGNRYLAGITGETAAAAGRAQTREGARYRRLSRRRGVAKAQVAIGNTQLKVYHKLLSSPGMRYQDLGPDYYERQASARRHIAHHVGKLGALGFEVTLCHFPDPEQTQTPQARPRPPDPYSTSQALTGSRWPGSSYRAPSSSSPFFRLDGRPHCRSSCRAASGPRSLALPAVRVGLPPDYS